MMVQYMGAGDFPAESNHVGARNKGASSGVGISFNSGGALLNALDLYKKANGHSIGQDLQQLRSCIDAMDDLNNQIAQADANLQALQDQIDDANNQIADLQQQLADCMAECDALEMQLQDLAAQNAECLELLEKQRKAEDALREAERAGDDVQDKADNVENEADQADETIGGRSGSPSQMQEDMDDVQEGRDCKDIAQGYIDQGNQKLAEGRAANAAGDTELAEQLAAEAKMLFAQADQKLNQSRERINEGRSSAQQRKPRECQGGAFRMGTEMDYPVWTEIIDVTIVPHPRKPKDWASSMANTQKALDGLKTFLAIVDFVGDRSPIGGTFTPNADEIADAVVGAFSRIVNNYFPSDVYVRVRGHTAWRRTDRRCVDGCWINEPQSGDRGDVIEKEQFIGTIWPSRNKDRKKQLSEMLERYASNLRSQSK